MQYHRGAIVRLTSCHKDRRPAWVTDGFPEESVLNEERGGYKTWNNQDLEPCWLEETHGKGYNLDGVALHIKPVPDNGGPSREPTKEQMADILKLATEQTPKLKND